MTAGCILRLLDFQDQPKSIGDHQLDAWHLDRAYEQAQLVIFDLDPAAALRNFSRVTVQGSGNVKENAGGWRVLTTCLFYRHCCIPV
jgi:hypothetical protein